ncbi:MAG TPA: hypothetical protein HA319_04085 [Nitrosopumilaceae archaeon]|nr:hypothetical protein [Nitrosopumilaceae archaeon]
MSQITKANEQKSVWVLVSGLKADTTELDLKKVVPSVIELVNDWQSRGNFIWSGPFQDNKTGMAIFEATEEDARTFYDKYDKICSDILDYHLDQWGAIPFLSAL